MKERVKEATIIRVHAMPAYFLEKANTCFLIVLNRV